MCPLRLLLLFPFKVIFFFLFFLCSGGSLGLNLLRCPLVCLILRAPGTEGSFIARVLQPALALQFPWARRRTHHEVVVPVELLLVAGPHDVVRVEAGHEEGDAVEHLTAACRKGRGTGDGEGRRL